MRFGKKMATLSHKHAKGASHHHITAHSKPPHPRARGLRKMAAKKRR